MATEAAPLEVIARLGEAAGSRELVGGQADDLAFETDKATVGALASILSIHARKTAALFRFAVWGAGRLLNAAPQVLGDLETFALHYGMAFQLVDDILDDDPTECSILRVLSREQARARAQQELSAARGALELFAERGAMLRDLGDELAGRLT